LAERTGVVHADSQQARSAFAVSVGGTWLFVPQAARHALPSHTDQPRATVGPIVDLAVTVVVFAIAYLSGWAHPAHASPAIHSLTLKAPWSAFALQRRPGCQSGWIALDGWGNEVIVHDPVAVIVLPVTHLSCAPHFVAAHDVPAYTGSHPLLTHTNRVAANFPDTGHTVVHLVDQSITVIVDAVADLGAGVERLHATYHLRPRGVADILARAIARPLVAGLAQAREILVHAAIAIVVLAVAQILRGRHRTYAGQLAFARDGVGLTPRVPETADADTLSSRHITAHCVRGIAKGT